MKQCNRCHEQKPLDCFSRHKSSADGLDGRCKSCWSKYQRERRQNNYEHVRALERKYYERHREKKRAYSKWWRQARNNGGRLKNYGLYPETVETWFWLQGGKCWTCKKVLDLNSRHTHIDHDHKTGILRGILCHGCNTALGLVYDSPKTLRALADYLEVRKMKIEQALALPSVIGLGPGISPGAVNVTLKEHSKAGQRVLTFHPLNGANPGGMGVSFTEAANTDPDQDEDIYGAAIQSAGF